MRQPLNGRARFFARPPAGPAILIIILACCAGCAPGGGEAPPDAATMSGPYLGQPDPGSEPAIFAPGIVSRGMPARDVSFTPDGREMFFCWSVGKLAFCAILHTRLVDGVWTEPEVAPFSLDSRYRHFEPQVSPDGSRLFFVSDRPDSARGRLDKNEDIWIVDRVGDGWGEPYNPGPPLNSAESEYFPSATREGVVYFTRNDPESRVEHFWRSRSLPGGGYAEPEMLPEQVNAGRTRFNGFVAPDESYMITCVFGRDDSLGGVDYYVSFRSEQDVWTGPFNLGPLVNSAEGAEWSPYVTPDGRYFFFMSSRRKPEAEEPFRLSREKMLRMHELPGFGQSAIWWVDAGFIAELNPDRAQQEDAGDVD